MKNFAGNQPCAACFATKETWHNSYDEISDGGDCPYPLRTHTSYLEEVERRTVHVIVLDEQTRVNLVVNTMFKVAYPFGRVVVGRSVAMLELGLKPQDRLCPYAGSIGSLHELDSAPLPMHVVIFRGGAHTYVSGWSMLWCIPQVGSGPPSRVGKRVQTRLLKLL